MRPRLEEAAEEGRREGLGLEVEVKEDRAVGEIGAQEEETVEGKKSTLPVAEEVEEGMGGKGGTAPVRHSGDDPALHHLVTATTTGIGMTVEEEGGTTIEMTGAGEGGTTTVRGSGGGVGVERGSQGGTQEEVGVIGERVRRGERGRTSGGGSSTIETPIFSSLIALQRLRLLSAQIPKLSRALSRRGDRQACCSEVGSSVSLHLLLCFVTTQIHLLALLATV